MNKTVEHDMEAGLYAGADRDNSEQPQATTSCKPLPQFQVYQRHAEGDGHTTGRIGNLVQGDWGNRKKCGSSRRTLVEAKTSGKCSAMAIVADAMVTLSAC